MTKSLASWPHELKTERKGEKNLNVANKVEARSRTEMNEID